MSKYIDFQPKRCDMIDLTVKGKEDNARVYLGRGSSVITFPLDELDKFIEFVNKAKELAKELD